MPFELRPALHQTLRLNSGELKRAWREYLYPLANQLNIHIVLRKISPHAPTGQALVWDHARYQGLASLSHFRMLRTTNPI